MCKTVKKNKDKEVLRWVDALGMKISKAFLETLKDWSLGHDVV